jgi:hypothetical protein
MVPQAKTRLARVGVVAFAALVAVATLSTAANAAGEGDEQPSKSDTVVSIPENRDRADVESDAHRRDAEGSERQAGTEVEARSSVAASPQSPPARVLGSQFQAEQASSDQSLPRTGVNVVAFVLLAVLCLGAGFMSLRAGHRRVVVRQSPPARVLGSQVQAEQASSEQSLPRTGMNVMDFVLLAVLCLGAGFTSLRAGHRQAVS